MMSDWPVDVPPAFESLLEAAGVGPTSSEDEVQDALTGILLAHAAQDGGPPHRSSIGHWVRYCLHLGHNARERWSPATPAMRRIAAELLSEADWFDGAPDLDDPRLPERLGVSPMVIAECAAYIMAPICLERAADELGLFSHQDPTWLERDWWPDADVRPSLADLTRDVDHEFTVDANNLSASMARVLEDATERQRMVLQSHYGFGGPPMTASEIGEYFDLSRQAIHNLRATGLERVRQANLMHLLGQSSWEVPLREDHTPGRPDGSRLLVPRPPQVDDRVEAHIEMLWVLGEGEEVIVEDLLAMVPSDLSADELSALMERDDRLLLGQDGRIRIRGDAKSLVPSAWRWTPPRGERARQMEIAIGVLRSTGRPMPFEELETAVGSLITTRRLRHNLSGIAEVNRADRDTFALAEWGHEAYDTVESLIKRHIERDGGEARIIDIITDLTARFSVKAATVRVYAKTDAFVRTSPGTIRVRLPDEEIEEDPQPVSAIPRCFVIDGRRSLHVLVDEKLLRGFSPTIPQGFAHHLKVRRQTSELLPTDDGRKVSVVRRGMHDVMGRLRPIAESLSLRPGDLLIVSAPKGGPGPLSFAGIKRDYLEGLSPAERLTTLMGLEGPADTRSVAQSLGMPVRSTATALAGALRVRGEPELAADVLEVLGGGSAEGPATDEFAKLLGL